MDGKGIKEQYTEFTWTVFLESLAKSQIGKTQQEIEADLWELFPLKTETVQ